MGFLGTVGRVLTAEHGSGVETGYESGAAGYEAGPTACYECLGCRSSFELQYHVCPDCGGFSIERSDWGLLD